MPTLFVTVQILKFLLQVSYHSYKPSRPEGLDAKLTMSKFSLGAAKVTCHDDVISTTNQTHMHVTRLLITVLAVSKHVA